MKRNEILARKRYRTDDKFRQVKLEASERWRLDQQKKKTEKWKRRLLITRQWQIKNAAHIKTRDKHRHATRYKNPTYRISKLVSNRINALIRDKNGKSWTKLVDYTIDELKLHLQKKFKIGMNWENYGKVWHIDHIKPVSHFNFSSRDDDDFKKCWSLDNLQPLFKHENLSKSNRYVG